MDKHHIMHDLPGYSNPRCLEGDQILQVDGLDAVHVDLTTLRSMLAGPVASTVFISLARPSTGEVYRVEALRHEKDARADHRDQQVPGLMIHQPLHPADSIWSGDERGGSWMSDGQRGIEGGWGYWRTADIPSATATRSIQPPAVPVSTQAQGAAGHAGSGPDAPAMGEAGSGASLNAGSGPDASAMAEADSGASLNDVFGYWGKQYDKLAKQAAAAVGVDTLDSVPSPFGAHSAATTAPPGSSPPLAPARPSRRAQRTNPATVWSVEQVAVFLQKISFAEAAVIAQDNQVDGKTLLDLTDTELKTDLALRPLQIKRLRKEIQTLES